MTKNLYRINEGEFHDACTFPTLRDLLPDYIADQLGHAASEAVEDHLLACPPCRQTYLEYLKLLSSAYSAFTELSADGSNRASKNGAESNGAKVLMLEEFKRRRH